MYFLSHAEQKLNNQTHRPQTLSPPVRNIKEQRHHLRTHQQLHQPPGPTRKGKVKVRWRGEKEQGAQRGNRKDEQTTKKQKFQVLPPKSRIEDLNKKIS